jgi:hypothetical protein
MAEESPNQPNEVPVDGLPTVRLRSSKPQYANRRDQVGRWG